MPPKPDLYGIEEFVNEPVVSEPTVKKPVVESSKAKGSTNMPKVVRKNFGSLIIKDCISDGKDEDESKPKIEKKLKNNMFSVDLKNSVPKGDLTCLFAKATSDEYCKSKSFRVFNNRTRIVEENLHIRFSENTLNIAGSGPNWLFNIDALTKSMNYKSVVAGNQSNGNAGTKACDDEESKSSQNDGFQPSSVNGKKVDEDPQQESECKDQEKEDNVNNTNNVNAAGKMAICDLGYGAFGYVFIEMIKHDFLSAKTINGEVQLQALVDGKKAIITKSTIRRDLQLEDAEGDDCLPNASIFEQLTLLGVGKHFSGRVTHLFPTTMVQAQEKMGEDEAVNEEIDDSLERVATTATSLDAEQDKCNIFKTQSKATPNKPGSQGTSSGSGLRFQETIWDTIVETRSKRVSKISNDPLLAGVNIPQSGKDSLKLTELMELCTKLQQRVLDLETTKTTHALDINSFKRRVKKLERRKRSRTHGLKRLYNIRLSARVKSFKDEGLAKEVVDDITLAKALMEIKSSKPKADKVVIQEPEHGTTTTIPTTITAASSRPKAKGLVIQEQGQAPTPIVFFTTTFTEEQDELTNAEKAKLFIQFLEKRRKFFAAKRAVEKRNRPPIKA
nr:hypothetical protein [Tanacetum cinerariifolium]